MARKKKTHKEARCLHCNAGCKMRTKKLQSSCWLLPHGLQLASKRSCSASQQFARQISTGPDEAV
eukprot:6053425-Pleurochrysis_carterae.AAC.1